MDIVIDTVSVSRRQARIEMTASGQWVVEDLNSANGTFVNGQRLTSPRPLARGDEISFGKFSLFFDRALRRWSFATATTVATAAYLARYLVDPLLPKNAELVAGAVFYLALLGVANCWLLTRSQSLVPGLLSSLLFFAAYRTLGAR